MNMANRIIADHILMLFNADHANEIPFTLPHLASVNHGNGCLTLLHSKNKASHSYPAPMLSSLASVAVLRSPVSKQSVEVEEKPEEVLEKTDVDRDIDIVTALR